MKNLAFLLALLTVLCLVGCTAKTTGTAPDATPSASTAAPDTSTPDTAVPATEAPATSSRETLPDFTVQTINGGSFTLSEALQTHELVLINLFATWCGPCKMEFPYLQEAWEQSSDRVAVIALSVEPTDSDAVLQSFAKEYGLSFPIGNEAGTELSRFVTSGIPTTVLVDRLGLVAGVEVGAKSSMQEFLTLFDNFTGEDYDPNVCTYTVYAYDVATYQTVEGVVLNFCTDTTCTPVTTDANGVAIFTGPPASYHVQILSAPAGWEAVDNADIYTGPYTQVLYVPLRAVGE